MEGAVHVWCQQGVLKSESKEDEATKIPHTTRFSCRRRRVGTIYHQHVIFETDTLSAKLQGRRLRITRLSRVTASITTHLHLKEHQRTQRVTLIE